MGLSGQSRQQIFDELRGCFVKATPEELVRQQWAQHLTRVLGFPKELIAIEKQMKELPHLAHLPGIPDRRVDLLCYGKGPSGLYPLLLIECKVAPLTQKGLDQVRGYNHHIQAPFVAVVNQDAAQFSCLQGEFACDFLPPFKELVEWLRC
jgi:hypothetical protein